MSMSFITQLWGSFSLITYLIEGYILVRGLELEWNSGVCIWLHLPLKTFRASIFHLRPFRQTILEVELVAFQ